MTSPISGTASSLPNIVTIPGFYADIVTSGAATDPIGSAVSNATELRLWDYSPRNKEWTAGSVTYTPSASGSNSRGSARDCLPDGILPFLQVTSKLGSTCDATKSALDQYVISDIQQDTYHKEPLMPLKPGVGAITAAESSWRKGQPNCPLFEVSMTIKQRDGTVLKAASDRG